ncbi:MAG: hypothetical protein WC846_01540 [Candidatus Gracilibacteria bacterium]|jgi:hypothetical protein
MSTADSNKTQAEPLISAPDSTEGIPDLAVEELIKRGEEALVLAGSPSDTELNSDGVEGTEEDEVAKERVTFAEAVTILGDTFDLEAAWTQAVQTHMRWGLVDALIRMGVVKDAKAYGDLLKNVTISRSSLMKVMDMQNNGYNMMAIFDAGAMLPSGVSILFPEVPFHYRGDRDLVEVRRISPKDIEGLKDLGDMQVGEQKTALVGAYKRTRVLTCTGPRIIFTPNELEMMEKGARRTPYAEDMQACGRGERVFMDPIADMIRYRTQIETGLRQIAISQGVDFDNMDTAAYHQFLLQVFKDKSIDQYRPDMKNWTRYPNYVSASGQILNFQWMIISSSDDGGEELWGICMFFDDPITNRDSVCGSRISLG